MERCVEIPSGPLRLAGVLHLPPARGPLPGVVASHGLESERGSRKLAALARALEGEMAVLRFDQRGCGESPGDPGDLRGRLDDLRAALRFLRSQGPVRAGPVGLAGSSFGAHISLRVAAESDAKALVALACPAEMPGMGDGREAAARLRCPALFVHGTRDAVVPPSDSRKLWERVRGVKELQLIEGAGHRFSDPVHERRAVELAAAWLRRHLAV